MTQRRWRESRQLEFSAVRSNMIRSNGTVQYALSSFINKGKKEIIKKENWP